MSEDVYDEEFYRRYIRKSSFYKIYTQMRNGFIKKQIIKHVPSGDLLEIGFGDDSFIKLFTEHFSVFGVDISEFVVNNIRKEFDPENFKLCDVSKEKIPFDREFDVISSIHTVEHFEDPEFAFKNIFSLLRHDGVMSVYLPTQNNPFSKLLYKRRYEHPTHVYRPSISSLNELLTSVGFRKLEEYCAEFIPFSIRNKRIMNFFNLYLALYSK